jgi:serine/threonine-protein kinase
MSEQRIERPAAAVSSGSGETSHTLPPELMAEAGWRLGQLGLLYSAGILAEHFGRKALQALTGSFDVSVGIEDLFSIAAVAMGVVVYTVARRGVLSPKGLLDFGLVFQVAGAFGIAVSGWWDGIPRTAGGTFTFVPAECLWIVVFPLVVPNTPGKVLVASLLAASMGPVALALSRAVTDVAVDRPLVLATYFLTSDYLSAIVAYIIARIVHRFGMRLKHARDIGSYELIEKIGEGGMGEVWRAKHRLLARPAAIKLIRRDVLGSSQRSRDAIVRRFEREARDTATLGSTHTIDVYDFGITEEGDFYYVMELLNGISLERAVQVFGPMEPARAVYLLQQVCHSLREAHTRGLVHRDIKPANIFMCRLGPDDDFIKVLDFGLVKHLEMTPPGTMLTMEGTTAGTPAYMAPEIALGHTDVDGRADIYSLACVAYYMLTGQPVFSADSAVATALAHVKDEPIPPSVRSELVIPPALDALILECLAKDPADRPQTAALLGERLESTIARKTWTAEAAHAWWELHRVTLAGGVQPSVTQAETGEQPAAQAECPRCWPRLDRTPHTSETLQAR